MATIVGTGANDTLFGTNEKDGIWGLGGNDRLDGGAGSDFLYGGTGNDVLTASSGFDRLDGGDGDDRLVLNGVGGAVTGGAGIDTLAIDLSGRYEAVTFNALNGHGIIGGDWNEANHIYFRDVEHLELTTGSGNDFVRGSIGDDIISTGAGADRIGQGYSDEPGDSAGNDTIDAGAGDDIIDDFYGANHLFGGTGDDSIHTAFSSAELDGGDGNDILVLQDWMRRESVTVDFAQGTASTGTIFRNFEFATVQTGWGNDTVLGSDLIRLKVNMHAGDDHFEGAGRDESADGGAGNDSLFGGGGRDSLSGSIGDDHLDGGADNDGLFGDEGNDVLLGGDGSDTIWGGSGDDHIEGGAGNDILWAVSSSLGGTAGDDVLLGGDGDDWIFGGNGVDHIDILSGGSGADRLEGQLGADILEGGSDADTFVWKEDTARLNGGIDHITDFDTVGGDVIDLIGFASSSTGIHDFNSLLAASHDTAEGVYVSFDGDTSGILIEGVTLADLSDGDVVFT